MLQDLQTYTIQQTAEMLGLTEESTLALVHRGDLPASNLNTKPNAQRPRWRVLGGDIAKLLAKTRTAPATPEPKRAKAKPSVKDYFG